VTVGLFIIVTGIIFNLTLLFNQFLVSKCTSAYFKQFMVAFYAPLKPSHQYWVGLLLLTRNISYLTSELLNANQKPKYSLHIIFSLVVGLLLLKFIYIGIPKNALMKFFNRNQRNAALFDISDIVTRREGHSDHNHMRESTHHKDEVSGIVYRNPCLDLLETSFLINLLLFTYFTLYFYDDGRKQDILFYISSSVVLLSFIGILIYHISAYTTTSALVRKLKNPPPNERTRLISSD